jgi:hypothetical protein
MTLTDAPETCSQGLRRQELQLFPSVRFHTSIIVVFERKLGITSSARISSEVRASILFRIWVTHAMLMFRCSFSLRQMPRGSYAKN